MNAKQLAILSLAIRTINDTLKHATMSPGEYEALEQTGNDLNKLYEMPDDDLKKLANTVIETSLHWTGADEEAIPGLKKIRTLAGLAVKQKTRTLAGLAVKQVFKDEKL